MFAFSKEHAISRKDINIRDERQKLRISFLQAEYAKNMIACQYTGVQKQLVFTDDNALNVMLFDS